MTMLRRAPREVYRVYEEDEFFACADREERFESGASAPTARRSHRLAGATMLLAVAGALGGLTATTGLSSVAGTRRRSGARLLVASDPPASSRIANGRIWPAREGSNGRSATAPKDRGAASIRSLGGARRAANGHPAAVSRRKGGSRHAAIATAAGAPAAAGAVAAGSTGAPIELASTASAPPAPATASARPRPPGQPEFGFER
jgi:hypothetical protein